VPDVPPLRPLEVGPGQVPAARGSWLARDPLDIARGRLLSAGIADEAIAAVEDSTRRELEAAVEAALAAPYPDPSEGATEFAPAA
jgi:TPP-dependent pyruvate/acetoin dehydrogenase alpha subunit